jgi:hypothetical protein
MTMVGAAAMTGVVGLGAMTAGAASAPTGFNQGASVHAHPAVVTGTYEIFGGNHDFGALTLNSDFTFTVPALGDSGVWTNTGNSFAMSVTATTVSGGGDVGCTFSGTINKKGINGAKAKKQGNYICPGNGAFSRWYATKS